MPDDDTIPMQISDTVARGTVKPTYPVIQYPHNRETGGDAIANGFVYRGKLIPALRDKLVFGDITTGRIWYANRADVLAADDGERDDRRTDPRDRHRPAPIIEETYRERGGKTPALPGMGAVAGRGRVDVRFAEDNDGELYILTKSDGMIRKVVGARETTAPRRQPLRRRRPPTPSPGRTSAVSQPRPSRIPSHRRPSRSPPGSGLTTPIAPPATATVAQGAVKAGITISIIEEQKARQPPDLTDDQWDHGSTDGEIFTVIKRGVPPTMMPGFDGRIPDADIWSIVNYLRTLRSGK